MKTINALLNGFFFSVGCVLILYVTNRDVFIYVPPSNIIPPLIFSIVIYLLFVLIISFFLRDVEVAGLIATLFVLGLLYLWPFFVAIIVTTLLSILIVRLFRKKVRYSDVHLILNVISIAIFGFYLYQFSSMILGLPWASYHGTIQPVDTKSPIVSTQGSTPDIYYIILDGYGRADMLQSVYGFDNSAFIDGLEQRGLIVENGSQSNYPRTILSLASSLNMQYLDTMSKKMADSNLWWPIMGTIHQSQVREFLEKQGYRTVFIASGFDFTDIRDGNDYLKPFPIMLNDFEKNFLRFTNLSVFSNLDRDLISSQSVFTDRKVIIYAFDSLSHVAALQSPKFVFVHILSPHPPFVFDENGPRIIDPNKPLYIGDATQFQGDLSEYRKGYIAQVNFVNTQVLKAVDDILTDSINPPIIIIQGDHGPGMFFDYESSSDSCLYERYSILNAYYFPGVAPASVPEDINPVNTFRYIFNTYFGTGFELLPNRQYFSTSAHFYQFQDVTNQTVIKCNLPPEISP
jgi:hypothetical protein